MKIRRRRALEDTMRTNKYGASTSSTKVIIAFWGIWVPCWPARFRFSISINGYAELLSDPHGVVILNRFQQKRKERCFEKNIRYYVCQEVAFRVKLQDHIAADKWKIIELQEEMIRVEATKKSRGLRLGGKDEYTDADINGIYKKMVEFWATFIFR